MMLRLMDVVLAGFGLLVTLPFMAVLYLAGLFDTGAPLFRQVRVGQHQKPFTLIKFRTMRPDTSQVASHLADARAITTLGAFLRRTKLDELPQLWNVLNGDMSLVGPRPCLPSQVELVEARERLGVFVVRPGITGLAQVSGIDMSTPELLAQTDAKMIRSMSIGNYLRYVLQTVLGKGGGDAIQR